MDQDPITKKDLMELKEAVVNQLTEAIRDAQTEVLRAFYSWSRPMEARTKPVEEHAQRLAWLEARVAELELKNLMGGKQ
jgi:response regulator RpfG family c-di-GMP phosphodiesterase